MLRVPSFVQIIGFLLLVAGVIFLSLAIGRDLRLIVQGEKAEGKITNIVERHSRNPKKRRKGESREAFNERKSEPSISYYCDVEFTPKGATEVVKFTTLSTFGHDNDVGDPVPVIYMPSNPSWAEIDLPKQTLYPLIIGIVFSTVLIASGGAITYYQLRKSIDNNK